MRCVLARVFCAFVLVCLGVSSSGCGKDEVKELPTKPGRLPPQEGAAPPKDVDGE